MVGVGGGGPAGRGQALHLRWGQGDMDGGVAVGLGRGFLRLGVVDGVPGGVEDEEPGGEAVVCVVVKCAGVEADVVVADDGGGGGAVLAGPAGTSAAAGVAGDVVIGDRQIRNVLGGGGAAEELLPGQAVCFVGGPDAPGLGGLAADGVLDGAGDIPVDVVIVVSAAGVAPGGILVGVARGPGGLVVPGGGGADPGRGVQPHRLLRAGRRPVLGGVQRGGADHRLAVQLGGDGQPHERPGHPQAGARTGR